MSRLQRKSPLRPTRCPECLKGRTTCAGCRKGAGLRGKGARKRPNPVNKERRAKNSNRAYGPPERRKWLTLGKCVGCKVQGTPDRPLHQHHSETGGMGYKAGYETLVGLCFQCHAYVHDHGQAAYERAAKVDLKAEAAKTEARWQALKPSAGRSPD